MLFPVELGARARHAGPAGQMDARARRNSTSAPLGGASRSKLVVWTHLLMFLLDKLALLEVRSKFQVVLD